MLLLILLTVIAVKIHMFWKKVLINAIVNKGNCLKSPAQSAKIVQMSFQIAVHVMKTIYFKGNVLFVTMLLFMTMEHTNVLIILPEM